MKKTLTTLLLSAIFVGSLQAQMVVKGTVSDDQQAPLSFASIALIRAADSSLIKGALSEDNGSYRIEEVAPGNYRIFASSVGFAPLYSDAFSLESDNKSATVDLKMSPSQNVLEGVTIEATRPLFEQKADRLVVNVANSPIAAGGTALEILTKVPGVLIIQDKVTLAGNQTVQIWIDGKPSPYQDMNTALRDMPGDQIDRIELIRQPGARYDAAGGPILNIILKRNAELGLKGTAQMTLAGFRYDQSDFNAGSQNYGRINPSLTLNYRQGAWNVFGNAAHNQGTYFTGMKVNRYIGAETYLSRNLENSNYVFQNARFGADFYATQKTTLGVLFKTFRRTGEGDASNETRVFSKDLSTNLGNFITDNIENSRNSSASGNFNIKHDFDARSGHSLNFDVDYSTFSRRNVNDLAIYESPLSSFVSNSQQVVDQPVDLWAAKADYDLPIDSTLKLGLGAKSTFATIDNDLQFYRGGVLSTDESNVFLYKENINAGYANLNKTFQKLEFNAGLRMEQTLATGTTENQKVLDRNLVQWFPNASLLYKLNTHMGIQASYSKRVNRPSFSQQNPFVQFIDSLTYTRGNPALLPEIAHSGQLSLLYDGQPFASIEYTRTEDVIIENAPELEGTKTFTTAQNLANKYNWTFQLNFPVKIGKWLEGYGGNQAIYNAYEAEYLGTRFDASRWHWLGYTGVTASLPKGIKMELNGWYMTTFLEEFIVIKSMGGINLGASKTFWDGRGRLSANFNDILYSQITDARIAYQDIVVDFYQRDFSRNMRLSFSYQFGNTQVKSSRNRTSASESESSRVKVD